MHVAIAEARRVVIKIGSSSLTTPDGHIDDERVAVLCEALAKRHAQGDEPVLVSSGAIATGMEPLGLVRRPRDLATQQAAASVGQLMLMARYAQAFAGHGIHIGQVLLTVDDMVRRSHHRNGQRTLERLLSLRTVPIVNENDTVATEEIRFGDNDRLAALVAHLIRADALVLLSDVDGLYNGDPRRPGATKITEVAVDDALNDVELGRSGARGVGTGGMATKVQAARIATGAGIPTLLTDADTVGPALVGERVGTYFHPAQRRPARRLLWLAHATTGRGRLVLDAGAVEAVVGRRTSLLPAGVIGVDGEFDAGDPVDLCAESGRVIGRGLVNYDASEVPGLMGRSTRWLSREMGPEYQRELVHRDDLVVLVRRGTGEQKGDGDE